MIFSQCTWSANQTQYEQMTIYLCINFSNLLDQKFPCHMKSIFFYCVLLVFFFYMFFTNINEWHIFFSGIVILLIPSSSETLRSPYITHHYTCHTIQFLANWGTLKKSSKATDSQYIWPLLLLLWSGCDFGRV